MPTRNTTNRRTSYGMAGITLRKVWHAESCHLAGTYAGPFVPESARQCDCSYDSGVTVERFTIQLGTPEPDGTLDVHDTFPAPTSGKIDAVAEWQTHVENMVRDEMSFSREESSRVNRLLDRIGDEPLDLNFVSGIIEVDMMDLFGVVWSMRITRIL